MLILPALLIQITCVAWWGALLFLQALVSSSLNGMGVLQDPPGPWNPSPSLFLFPSLWGYVSLSGFVSPISLSGFLSSSVNVHLFHRLLSCLTFKSLSSPTVSAILFLSAPMHSYLSCPSLP